MMLSYARTLFRNYQDQVEEVVEDAAYTAAQEFHQYYTGKDSFENWIRTVIRYEVLRRYKRMGVTSPIENDAVAFGIDKVFENLESVPASDWEKRIHILWRCVVELPKNAKNVLRLQYISGYTTKVISKKVTKSPATVAKGLAMARLKVSQRIAKKAGKAE